MNQKTPTPTKEPLVDAFKRDNYWVYPAAAALAIIVLGLTFRYLGSFDHALLNAIGAIPSSAKPLMQGLTAAATAPAIFAIAIIFIGYLFFVKRLRSAYILIGALVSQVLLYEILGQIFRRVRPSGVDVVAYGVHSSSFPSGHAASSAVVSLVIVYLLSKHVSSVVSRTLMIIASVFVVAVAVSRVYLGFHYPTDILGGWLVALFVFLIAKRIADVRITDTTPN
jgi:undecaprenyl-diphosphatase